MTAFRPWQLIHVALEKPITAHENIAGVEGAFVFYWWHDIPLGMAKIPESQLPQSGTAIAEMGAHAVAGPVRHNLAYHGKDQDGWKRLAQPLAEFKKLLDERCREGRKFSASIIVCTRNRPALLAKCLETLGATLSPGDEIVVVDNEPSLPETRTVVAGFAFARHIPEPVPGLDVARNTGIRASRGELIVFCDDDVRVVSGWLDRVKAAFVDPAVMAMTGLVLPAGLDTEAEYLFETLWGFNRGFKTRRYDAAYFSTHRASGVPVWEIGAGANMAFRRSVLSLVGGFDERLDAGAAGCSGDSEMWYRILVRGFDCVYEPSAVAFHQHRRELSELEKQIFHYMRGHAAALLVQFERTGHWGNIRRLLLSIPKYLAGKSLRQIFKNEPHRGRLLLAELRGWAAGILYYVSQERRIPPAIEPLGPIETRSSAARGGS